MTRASIAFLILMSIACSNALASTLPGQDITARASVAYCVQSDVSASACVVFTDQTNAAQQSDSEPSTATVETSVAPVYAGPATAFVAPDPMAPLYFTTTNSFYAGASLVGKQVKLAGHLRYLNGTPYIDDGGTTAGADGVSTPSGVPLRTDLVSSLPQDGTLVTVQGIVRLETNGQPALLPLSDAGIIAVQ